MFSTELGFTLEAAFREASTRRHAYFSLEHILYAFLFEDSIKSLLDWCKIDIEELKRKLESWFQHCELLSPDEAEPVQTPAVQRVLQNAVRYRISNNTLVTPLEVFAILMDEEDTDATFFLAELGLNNSDVLNFFNNSFKNEGGDYNRLNSNVAYDNNYSFDDTLKSEQPSQVLFKYTEDLTLRAQNQKLDQVVGRVTEIDRAIRILSRRQKNNPLLIGEPGVGKSAIANGLAYKITNDNHISANLKGTSLFSLNMGTLLAGTKFRGDFEERFKALLDALKNHGNSILLIDEIHTVVGAGSTDGNSIDAASLLKPALTEGWLRCIGITTYEDYRKTFKRDKAFERRFSVIEVAEPTIEDTIEILTGLKKHYEVHHKVKYSKPAIKSAAELSSKYIQDRYLPDKAIDLIDEAGAKASLERKRAIPILRTKDIAEIVSSMAKIPIPIVAVDDTEKLRSLESRLKNLVFGQDHAIESVVKAIKRNRAQLGQPQHPVGCFLFSGPTGVGKTELAKSIAKELGVKFHRFDMSEYMEKHAVAKLIGAPPGYVGHEEGGQLIDLVRKHPYSVLLLDEIEKAHSDIFNILLQVMDDAILTDSLGRKADFRHCIVVLTTNAGSKNSNSIGFAKDTVKESNLTEIKNLFSPEFRNRLDEMIYFNPLSQKIIEEITIKLIGEFSNFLKTRKIQLNVDDNAVKLIANLGFDPVLGARPMKRFIEREIKDKLTDYLLFGTINNVDIDVNDGKLRVITK
jgi:ATP-dependent Clp protease ATP-binding subunit ClpA